MAITLNLLQINGYDRLTVDAVAASARASKATVYRRWPSKAELVLAAFTEEVRQVVVLSDTGSLREDLLGLGTLIRAKAELHPSTIGAVLSELPRNPALPRPPTDGTVRELVDGVIIPGLPRPLGPS